MEQMGKHYLPVSLFWMSQEFFGTIHQEEKSAA